MSFAAISEKTVREYNGPLTRIREECVVKCYGRLDKDKLTSRRTG